MNTPNKLTLLRMILVLPFITLMALFVYEVSHNQSVALYSSWNHATSYFVGAGIIFTLAMITDFVDGYLARKNNQITNFGKLFDPLADKFMTTSAFVMLSLAGIVPFWLTLVFILRDILVDGSRNLAAKNNVQVAASIWGKAKTMLQSIGLVLIFFVYPASAEFGKDYFMDHQSWQLILLNIPVLISGLLSVISGALYFKAIKPYINVK